MKLSITALVSALMLFGAVAIGMAQTSPSTDTSSPSQTAPSPDAAKPSSDPAKPPADLKGEAKTDNSKTTIDIRTGRPDQRDDVSALPRSTTGERSTLFGMNPAVAIIAGGALLLIVILAIVALGRGGSSDVYVDRDRRM